MIMGLAHCCFLSLGLFLLSPVTMLRVYSCPQQEVQWQTVKRHLAEPGSPPPPPPARISAAPIPIAVCLSASLLSSTGTHPIPFTFCFRNFISGHKGGCDELSASCSSLTSIPAKFPLQREVTSIIALSGQRKEMSDGCFRVGVMVCQRLWLCSDSLATITGCLQLPQSVYWLQNRGQADNSLAEMLPVYDFFICNAKSYNAADYSLWEKEEMRHSAYKDKVFVVLSAD